MKRLVVLSGAGISAESGLQTFRDAGGLWEGHRIEEVATPEAWQRDPARVLEFYNYRRIYAKEAQPNNAHLMLAAMQASWDVRIITQNVDDLHERAGSKHVLHLHGSLFESRSSVDENLVYPIEKNIELGDTCEKGSQLRPNIVWFGEAVPMIEPAARLAATADVFLVVGTSLVVYPAAGLVDDVRPEVPIFVVDPKRPEVRNPARFHFIAERATAGIELFYKQLLQLS